MIDKAYSAFMNSIGRSLAPSFHFDQIHPSNYLLNITFFGSKRWAANFDAETVFANPWKVNNGVWPKLQCSMLQVNKLPILRFDI